MGDAERVKAPDLADDIKRIDIKEFREVGYLQEVNRRFLHPLGLALEVVSDGDGNERLGGIWDYRDDPEGMVFAEGYGADEEKADRIGREWAEKERTRAPLVGFMVQPVGVEAQW